MSKSIDLTEMEFQWWTTGIDESFEKVWGAARAQVLSRDGWRCRGMMDDGSRCVTEDGDLSRWARKPLGLQVHHVVARRDGGLRFSASNLVALCVSCYGQVEGRTRHIWYPDDATDWREYEQIKRVGRVVGARIPLEVFG